MINMDHGQRTVVGIGEALMVNGNIHTPFFVNTPEGPNTSLPEGAIIKHIIMIPPEGLINKHIIIKVRDNEQGRCPLPSTQ